MLRKLKTKYLDFINEDLYLKADLHKIIQDMSKTNGIASLLDTLTNSISYNDESQINYVTPSPLINMLAYVPLNKRDDGRDLFSSDISRTEMRIGRLVRKIISDVDVNKMRFKYTGKAIVSTERKINNSSELVTTLIFSSSKTGQDFSNLWQDSMFTMTYADDSGPDIRDKSCADIRVSIDGKVYNSKVYNFIDESYASRYDNDSIYFRLQLVDNLEIGSTDPIIMSRNSRFSANPDPFIYDIDMEIVNRFDGKLVNEFTDSDIEKFTNELVARIKMTRAEEDSKIEEVKGEEIRHWYNESSYQSKVGQLGGSCMSGPECARYFDIYTENPDVVSLLILKNKENKLLGRALLWKLQDGRMFMDRVYCLSDYDDRIFFKYAIDKGYYYRNTGSNKEIKYYSDGKEVTDMGQISVSLSNCHFDYYPYLDTLKDLDDDDSVLYNYFSGRDMELRDTGGKWTGYEDDEDYHDENMDDD